MLEALATAWLDRGNPTAGLMTLRQAAQLDPSNVAVYLQLGRILKKQNDLNGALEAFRHVLSIQPNLVEAQRAMREILLNIPETNRGTQPHL